MAWRVFISIRFVRAGGRLMGAVGSRAASIRGRKREHTSWYFSEWMDLWREALVHRSSLGWEVEEESESFSVKLERTAAKNNNLPRRREDAEGTTSKSHGPLCVFAPSRQVVALVRRRLFVS